MPESLGSYGPMIRLIDEVLNKPYFTLEMVAESIEKDVDLVARLLRFANAPQHRFAHKITSLPQAIAVIGTEGVRALLVASQVIETFTEIPCQLIEMRSFWRHSLACGLAARALGEQRQLAHPEQLFLAGLLHDIGQLVIFGQLPDYAAQIFGRYRTAVRQPQRGKVLLRELEVSVLGYDHQTIGEALLARWRFHPVLVQAAGYHHSPLLCGAARVETSIVHIADHLVNGMAYATLPETWLTPLNPAAWDLSGVSLPMIKRTVDRVDAELAVTEQMLLEPFAPPLVIPNSPVFPNANTDPLKCLS